ncbi:hypothetical protein [Sphingosinicella rhizophila]|uniref:Secreted protein n=1 Tax=Sphingosinicella rhizophila TaxID=3050082 RepID=A0ABU3Q3G1_9SPHN|nr:hypothetical protein [Sphingosinicella sp. GR2756]MDT9597950.1 hypothetical protein [Sphingosinicella sp. GR2756]
MKRIAGWTAVAAGLALLGACGDDDGAGGVTPEESRQLNEISETLDTSADSLTVTEDDMVDNGTLETSPSVPADNVAANSQ